MLNFFKRWREVPEKAEFSVETDIADPEAASKVAEVLKTYDSRPDREVATDFSVLSLEGDEWTVKVHEGIVYLSGENGLVQAQFSPSDAYTLGSMLQDMSVE